MSVVTKRKPKPKPRGPCRESEHAWVTDGIGPTQCRKCGAVPHPNPLKPKPRKASGPTLEQRVACIDRFLVEQNDWITSRDSWAKQTTDLLKDARARIDALESRDRLRDKSHDEPVSNANEVIGLYPPTTPVRHEWRRCSQDEFFAILSPRREHWWQFWRRG